MRTVDLIFTIDVPADTPPVERQLHHFIGDDMQLNFSLRDQAGQAVNLTVPNRKVFVALRTGDKPNSPLVFNRQPTGFQDQAGGRGYVEISAGDTAAAMPSTWYWDAVYEDENGKRQHLEPASRFSLHSSMSVPSTPVIPPPPGSRLTTQTTGTATEDVEIDQPLTQGVSIYDVYVKAQTPDGVEAAGWEVTVMVNRTQAGVVALLGESPNPDAQESTDGAVDWVIAASIQSGVVVLTVGGAAGQTVNWQIEYFKR